MNISMEYKNCGINFTENCTEAMKPFELSIERRKLCFFADIAFEGVIMFILCIFGFAGNTLSIICLSKDKSKTATPFLLISLELADTAFLLTAFMLRVFTTLTGAIARDSTLNNLGSAYIFAYIFPLALTAEMATVYLTLLVTLNRYVMVCRPYETSGICSMRHAKKHVFAVILMSVLYNMPRWFENVVVDKTIFDAETNQTTLRKWAAHTALGRNDYYKIIYGNIMYLLFFFLVPLITLIILNFNLVKALKEAKVKRAQLLNNRESAHSRSEDDITLVLIVVVVFFVVCQTPALITQILSAYSGMNGTCANDSFFFVRISDLLVVINSSMNFIIYCFCSRKFRHNLRKMICKNRGSYSPEHSVVTHTPKLNTRVTCTAVTQTKPQDTQV